MEQAFQRIRSVLSEDKLLVYPRYGKEFVVHTNSSDYQLGGVVSQEHHPVAFFSRKLTQAQKKYKTTEKELLGIVETIKQFRTILYGQKVVVLTDHKNMTYNTTDHASNRVLRQQLLLKEYGVKIWYIKGVKNVVADALSRLPTKSDNQPTEEAFLN